MDDDKIKTLPVKPKAETGRLMLVPPPREGCNHFQASFEIDVVGCKCKCLACGGEVSPWFVLNRMMDKECTWNRTREAYKDEMKRLAERSKTKCDHCGKMTRISFR